MRNKKNGSGLVFTNQAAGDIALAQGGNQRRAVIWNATASSFLFLFCSSDGSLPVGEYTHVA
jgi:hypothetical protein